MVKLPRPIAIAVFWLKLIGIPLLIISFANPIQDGWSALNNVFLDPAIQASTKALIGMIYFILFMIVGYAAFKSLKVWGLGVLFVFAGVIMWFLQSNGYVSFDSAQDFGWAGTVIVVVFAWIGVFGATIYKVMTGRFQTDAEDPDT